MDMRFAAVSFLLLATTSLCVIAKTKKPKGPPPASGGVPSWSPPGLPGGGGDTPSWPPGPGGYTPVWPPGPAGGGGSGCSCSCSCNDPRPRPPKVFVVGDTGKQWSYGTNYTDWALKNAPFYVGDVLEFKYAQPENGRPYNHSVHLLPDYESYQTCNLSRSLRMGSEYAGGGSNGFRFKLQKKTYPMWAQDPNVYMACGEKNGLHCGLGTMKFAIMPMFTDFP